MDSNLLQTITFVILAIGISVILHEVMHGYVAKYLGDRTAEEEGRLSLNPKVHIDPIFTLALPLFLAILGQPIFGAAKPVPVNNYNLKGQEFGMALVAIAGPLTNLALALVGALLLTLTDFNQIFQNWWLIFISVNIGFFIFNLIPIPPLDGSRVLYAFAPEFLQNIMIQLEKIGFLIILLLVILGFPFIGPIVNNLYDALFTALIG
jgi:Zn-dependent protease